MNRPGSRASWRHVGAPPADNPQVVDGRIEVPPEIGDGSRVAILVADDEESLTLLQELQRSARSVAEGAQAENPRSFSESAY